MSALLSGKRDGYGARTFVCTKYVVNSHRAARQIWMAAERSAWHFDLQQDKRWVAAKSGDELYAAIEGVLTRKLGREIKLR